MHRSILAPCILATALALPAQAQTSPEGPGFYVGAALGAGWSKSEGQVTLGGQWASEGTPLQDHVVSQWSRELKGNGFLGSLQVGYQHPVGERVVLGIELDLGFLKAEETMATGDVPVPSTPSLTYAFDHRAELKQPMSLQGRIGLRFDRHQPYLTLGFARAKAEASALILSSGSYRKLGSASENLNGFRWGLGYAYRIDRAWSAFAEFSSTDLGSLRYTTDYLPGSAFTDPAYVETFEQDFSLTALRIGATYRF